MEVMHWRKESLYFSWCWNTKPKIAPLVSPAKQQFEGHFSLAWDKMNKSENARRKPMQIYVPRHRRAAQSSSELTDVNTTMEGRFSPRVNASSSPDEVVRRGRGQFRAPVSANGKDVQRDSDVEPSNHVESHTKPTVTKSISIPNQSSPNSNSPSNCLRSNNKNVSMDELTAQTEKLVIDEGDSPKEDWEELLDTLDKEEEEEKKAAESAKKQAIPGKDGLLYENREWP
ncbi:hypothetical protein BJV82DRAFT_22991 [Fennellomyces sp. T-0311]|nr:hypothetical protein BJV82DRAFT_22991 [Fennellomyces sp. T-0311]